MPVVFRPINIFIQQTVMHNRDAVYKVTNIGLRTGSHQTIIVLRG